MVPTVDTNKIVARALGRLTSAFRNQPNIKAVTAAMLTGFPELEALFWQIINQRIISNLVIAVAASQPTYDQIDIIGGLVGEAREGRVDAAYLPAVQLRIRVNRSKGRSEDIIQIANLISPGAAQYAEYPIMSWVASIWNIVGVSVGTVASLLGQAKATGSYGALEYSTWPQAENLIMDYTVASPVASATLLDYTVASPVAGAGLLVGLAVCSPS